MLTLSLRQRLFAAYSLVVAAALLVVTLVSAREERSWLLRRDADTLEHVAHYVLSELVQDRKWAMLGWPRAAASLGQTLTYRVTLFDSSGRVIGDSAPPPGEPADPERAASSRPTPTSTAHTAASRNSRRGRTP